jgi:hypothetical protein
MEGGNFVKRMKHRKHNRQFAACEVTLQLDGNITYVML